MTLEFSTDRALRIATAVAAFWLFVGCVHPVAKVPISDSDIHSRMANSFATKWQQYAVVSTDSPIPTAKLHDDSLRRWKLTGGLELKHRSGRLRELEKLGGGHFTCDSSFELKGAGVLATAPSLLDEKLLAENEISFQQSVFEDRADSGVVVIERRNGGPERGVWFRPDKSSGKWSATAFELPYRETQRINGEWYPVEGIVGGRLYCRVDGKLYAFPISELPKATIDFTIG